MPNTVDDATLREVLRTAGVTDPLEPLRIGPEQQLRLVTHGGRAVSLWGRLRELTDTTGYYPVILGDAGQTDTIEGYAVDESPADETLARAARLTPDPASWTEARRRSLRKLLLEQGRADLVEAIDQERAANDAAPGEWPDDVEPQNGFVLPLDILTMQPLARVALALVPTRRGWETPAYLRFGGWNDCPAPEQQVAVMRSWYERFGAEPVGLGADIAELRVERPPRDRQAALALAREQFGYCSDVVDQGMGTIEALAASLLDGRTWYFWWD